MKLRSLAHSAAAAAILSIQSLALAQQAQPTPAPGARPAAAPAQPPKPPAQHPGETVGKLQLEANLLIPTLSSDLAKAFARASGALPGIEPRTYYRHKTTRQYYTTAQRAKLTEAELADIVDVECDESFYYLTRYGSPLAYSRPLDILAQHGFASTGGAGGAASGGGGAAGKRILDFGYGAIGHLRLLASLGAHVIGVEVDPLLHLLYAAPGDTGPIPRADEAGKAADRAAQGSIHLVHGRWPAEKEARDGVAHSGGAAPASLDLFLSKNTLKNGYIHPDPERSKDIDPRRLINLGVDDAAYCREVFALLKPGALFMIYNLSPAPAPPDKPYIPWADGRSPFSRETLESAGFEVIAFDADDNAGARAMARTLKWDLPQDQGGAGMNDLEADLFAHYTLCKKPANAK